MTTNFQVYLNIQVSDWYTWLTGPTWVIYVFADYRAPNDTMAQGDPMLTAAFLLKSLNFRIFYVIWVTWCCCWKWSMRYRGIIVPFLEDYMVRYHNSHTPKYPNNRKATVRYVHNAAWWRHQMETFSALLAICAGNSPVPGEFPTKRPVTRSFDVLLDLRLNKRLSKQSWGWWFETLSRPLWRHRNEVESIFFIAGP